MAFESFNRNDLVMELADQSKELFGFFLCLDWYVKIID